MTVVSGLSRTVLPVVASAIVLVAAPGIGQIRGWVQEAFPDHYRSIIVSLVAAALGAAVAGAVRAIRERRAQRYALIAAAISIGVVYSLATATGNPSVDAVERFHFVEYGGLTMLFARAWRHRSGVEAIVLPFLAVFIVGTLDEWIQWFVPGRVGEWRDVLLNTVAISCGLLFAAALYRIPAIQGSDPGSDPWILRIAGAATVAIFSAFFYTVHVGYEVRDPAIGSFRSRYSGAQLRALAAARRVEWRATPPLTAATYSREDQYLAEALWHVQRRNDVEGDGGIWTTWKENLILETYFAPILELPTYRTPEGARWPDEQRRNAAALAAAETRPFVSDAHPIPIYAWLGR